MSSSKQPYEFTSHPVKLQRGSLCGGRKPRLGKAESAASLRKWSQATLGFVHLPATYFLWVVFVVATYLLTVQGVKHLYRQRIGSWL